MLPTAARQVGRNETRPTLKEQLHSEALRIQDAIIMYVRWGLPVTSDRRHASKHLNVACLLRVEMYSCIVLDICTYDTSHIIRRCSSVGVPDGYTLQPRDLTLCRYTCKWLLGMSHQAIQLLPSPLKHRVL